MNLVCAKKGLQRRSAKGCVCPLEMPVFRFGAAAAQSSYTGRIRMGVVQILNHGSSNIQSLKVGALGDGVRHCTPHVTCGTRCSLSNVTLDVQTCCGTLTPSILAHVMFPHFPRIPGYPRSNCQSDLRCDNCWFCRAVGLLNCPQEMELQNGQRMTVR